MKKTIILTLCLLYVVGGKTVGDREMDKQIKKARREHFKLQNYSKNKLISIIVTKDNQIDSYRRDLAWFKKINKELMDLCTKSEIDVEKSLQKECPNRTENKNTLAFLSLGNIGTVDYVKVNQIIDSTNMLVNFKPLAASEAKLVWLKGVSSLGLADGDVVIIGFPCIVSGSKQYSNIMGSTNTVNVIEPFVVKDITLPKS